MWAASEGRSKLGIPEAVGKEFVKSDAAGRPEGDELTDHEAAEAIRDGELSSPQKYGDFWLFDLRITGTGAAYRDALDEYAVRDCKKWLSDEFVERCNGLQVIFGHPERSGLNHDEYRERSIGAIVLPYVKGDEVWGIAKIFDEDAAKLMQTSHRSTSPGVTPPKGSVPIVLESGAKVLDEGLPLILDHLAICEAGVWDKDGPPEGVRLDALFTRKGTVVTEEERKALEKERDDAKARADAAEKERDDAKHRADEFEKADKARKDAEETEKKAIEAAEKEKADSKKRDARKDRHSKHDGEIMDCSRCDSEEAEEAKEKEREAEERDKKDKGRKDGAPVENVEANEAAIKDSKTVKELQTQVQDLQGRLSRAERQPTMEDRNEIAKAFHRADTVYQMLGDHTPQAIPGESPSAYRRRLANGLRKYSEKWKDYVFHDALDASAFELVENSIYNDALAAAKNPVSLDGAGILREVRTTEMGKHVSRFFGDARVAWGPFMPPMRHFVTKINNAPDRR